jgi:hypothetical protein
MQPSKHAHARVGTIVSFLQPCTVYLLSRRSLVVVQVAVGSATPSFLPRVMKAVFLMLLSAPCQRSKQSYTCRCHFTMFSSSETSWPCSGGAPVQGRPHAGPWAQRGSPHRGVLGVRAAYQKIAHIHHNLPTLRTLVPGKAMVGAHAPPASAAHAAEMALTGAPSPRTAAEPFTFHQKH